MTGMLEDITPLSVTAKDATELDLGLTDEQMSHDSQHLKPSTIPPTEIIRTGSKTTRKDKFIAQNNVISGKTASKGGSRATSASRAKPR